VRRVIVDEITTALSDTVNRAVAGSHRWCESDDRQLARQNNWNKTPHQNDQWWPDFNQA